MAIYEQMIYEQEIQEAETKKQIELLTVKGEALLLDASEAEAHRIKVIMRREREKLSRKPMNDTQLTSLINVRTVS